MQDELKILNNEVFATATQLVQNLLTKHKDTILTSFVNFNNSADIKIDLKLNAKKGKLKITSGLGFSVQKVKDSDSFEIDLDQLELPFNEE